MSFYRIGFDVGSTTLKCVVQDEAGKIVYRAYERHFAQVRASSAEMLIRARAHLPNNAETYFCVSGSAGMGLADSLGFGFEQEVYSTLMAVRSAIPAADCVIELGGEDAKIIFVSGVPEVRMNGSCAGGTGAFIDQMASLLSVEPKELNALSENATQLYDIASRCGVFAKSDIQPLLNQGAPREDVAASIFSAVVHQVIAGLSQGRRIEGKVVYLGGPLTFFSSLRKRFDIELGVAGICPTDSLYFVAIGAAMSENARRIDLTEAIERIKSPGGSETYRHLQPLFADGEEYEAFEKRHAQRGGVHTAPVPEDGKLYIGIDAGSTTVKAAVIDESGALIDSFYAPNTGNPVPALREYLLNFYGAHPGAKLGAAASTGYGEELIKNAFQLDASLVETMAHYLAARAFEPDVDFIIDIGGQDIKCFKIRSGAMDNIFLNEACSSGCGSFLQTFAGAMNLSVDAFARLALFAQQPVDLGSRCTVFMNSSIKQAQKDGATVENIAAGLSISVVKNALYKVIRAADAKMLGEKIVVQGGTFLNDAVLRAFELEIGREVVRPAISGLMGAYGAALYAKSLGIQKSAMMNRAALQSFSHEVKRAVCSGCLNRCKLTVNVFKGGRRYVSGNRCDKPVRGEAPSERYNLYTYKRELLNAYRTGEGKRGTVGLAMGLNMYELLPFWHKFFERLDYKVVVSPESTRALYVKGQHTIPSDTVCYPAKLMHGHVEWLIDEGCDYIFYPCMSYNLNERLGDNHYNCPVVAYYPEVIEANTKEYGKSVFIKDYVGLHRKKDFPRKMAEILKKYGFQITEREVFRAAEDAYKEEEAFRRRIFEKGQEYLRIAKEKGLQTIVLAGRPYHLDGEINHGIDQMIGEFSAVVVSEEAISPLMEKEPTTVLNQWTYHARLYAAARYVARCGRKDVNLVQLVSFGCGIDAITTDEVRAILEEEKKIYTQIKIDEISNLGAARIRLRSLLTALSM